MSEEPIMLVQDAGVRYRRGWALKHCSLDLRPGTIIALVGLTEGHITSSARRSGRRRPTRTWASSPTTNRGTGSSRWPRCSTSVTT
jgi:ABC-type phosphonate transport system ATPase subunit